MTANSPPIPHSPQKLQTCLSLARLPGKVIAAATDPPLPFQPCAHIQTLHAQGQNSYLLLLYTGQTQAGPCAEADKAWSPQSSTS